MPTKTKRDEHKWERAKEIADDAGKKENFAYIMGIYKKMKPDYEFKTGPAAKSAVNRIATRWLAREAGETAVQAYDRRSKEIVKLLKDVDRHLKKHAQDFKKESTNWGYVGDLGHIAGELKSLMEGW